MLIKKEILINADIKKVWKIFCELENWPKWGGYIIKTKWLTKTKWKDGSQFLQIVKGFGPMRKFKSTPKIIKIKNYNIIIWSGTRKLIRGEHAFEFQKIGSKTKVVNFEDFKGTLAPILFPLMKKNFEAYFKQFLKGLKKEAEKKNQQSL